MAFLAMLVAAVALTAPAAGALRARSTSSGDFVAQNKGFELAIKADGTFGSSDVVDNEDFHSHGQALGIRFNLDRKTTGWHDQPRVAGDFIGTHGNQWCLHVVINSQEEDIRYRVPVLCNGVPNQAPKITPNGPVDGRKADNGDIVAVWSGETDCYCLACQDQDGNDLAVAECTTCTSSESYVCTEFFAAEVNHTFVAEETDASATPPKEGNKITLETVVSNVGNTDWAAYYVIRWINADPCGTGDDADTVYTTDYVPEDPYRDAHRVQVYHRDETYPRFGSTAAYCGLSGQDDKFLQIAHFGFAEQVRNEPARRRRDECDPFFDPECEECDWFFDPFCDPFGDSGWDGGTTCEANCQGGDNNENEYDEECDDCPRARRSNDGFPIIVSVRGVHAEGVARSRQLTRSYAQSNVHRPVPDAVPLPAGTAYRQTTLFYFTKPTTNDAESRKEGAVTSVGEQDIASLCCTAAGAVAKAQESLVGELLLPTFSCHGVCGAGEEPKATGDGCHNVCGPCDAGFYQDESGGAACKRCAANTYQDEPGQTSCKPCPAGFARASDSSAIYCTECIPPAVVGEDGACAHPGVVVSLPSAATCATFSPSDLALPLLPRTASDQSTRAWTLRQDGTLDATGSGSGGGDGLSTAKAVYQIAGVGANTHELFLSCNGRVYLSTITGRGSDRVETSDSFQCGSNGQYKKVGKIGASPRTLVVAPYNGGSELLSLLIAKPNQGTACSTAADKTPITAAGARATSFEHNSDDAVAHGVIRFTDASDVSSVQSGVRGDGRARAVSVTDLPRVGLATTGPFLPATGAKFLALDKGFTPINGIFSLPALATPLNVGNPVALSSPIAASSACTSVSFKWLAPNPASWDVCPFGTSRQQCSSNPAPGKSFPDRFLVHVVTESGSTPIVELDASQVRSAGRTGWQALSREFKTEPNSSFKLRLSLAVTEADEDLWIDDLVVSGC